MSTRGLAALAAVCGTAVLAGWFAAGNFSSPPSETTAAPIGDGHAASAPAIETVNAPQASGTANAGPSVSEAIAAEALPHAGPAPAPEAPLMQLAYANTPETLQREAKPEPPPSEVKIESTPTEVKIDTPEIEVKIEFAPSDVTPGTPANDAKEATEPLAPAQVADECGLLESCIDEFLWSAYQRAPKVDTIRVSERIKVTVKKKGKTRTVTKTVTKLVDEDFGWKDPKAAERAGMPLKDYVIGGMDKSFRLKLYRALRALDEAGLVPGITSGFRDDYRQGIASGHKAATDSSYHGGSRRGGYGHGMAADLVSVKGDTRGQRYVSSEALWKWIDAHGQVYGVGRPYLDRDPPHVGPIDGKEYIDKRIARVAVKQRVASKPKKSHVAAAGSDQNKTKPASSESAQAVAPPTSKPQGPAVSSNQDKPKPAAATTTRRVALQPNKPRVPAVRDEQNKTQIKTKPATPASAPRVAVQTSKPRVPVATADQTKTKPATPASAPRVAVQTSKPHAPAATADQNKTKPATPAGAPRVAVQTSKPHAPVAAADQSKTKPAAPAHVQRVALQTSKPHVPAARVDQSKTKRVKTEPSKANSI